MTVKSISTSKDIIIKTEHDTIYTVEISTYLGTIVFMDTITPVDKTIKIKGLSKGKYIIQISNNSSFTKEQISI